MRVIDLIEEMRNLNSRVVRMVEAYEVGDQGYLGSLLIDFGDDFETCLDAVEREGVTA